MSPRVPAVDSARLAQWCGEHLGSPAEAELFRSGCLSAVIGLRLADDRAGGSRDACKSSAACSSPAIHAPSRSLVLPRSATA